ncbi:hypothetical protein Tco_0800702 [Tanacetum coccineum]|uniref:Uncharacterized protein n=1 Tax=Tanacetum coccineum TaxID=301880 RepID=A0ABQ4ZTW3_9ASTR
MIGGNAHIKRQTKRRLERLDQEDVAYPNGGGCGGWCGVEGDRGGDIGGDDGYVEGRGCRQGGSDGEGVAEEVEARADGDRIDRGWIYSFYKFWHSPRLDGKLFRAMVGLVAGGVGVVRKKDEEREEAEYLLGFPYLSAQDTADTVGIRSYPS